MGGTIKLNEKERWASYYSAILKAAGHNEAAEYLYNLAYPNFGPIHKQQEEEIKNDWNQIVERIRTSQASHSFIPQEDRKPQKTQLLEDIYAYEFVD